MKILRNLSVKNKMLSMVCLFALGFILFGFISIGVIQKVKVNGPIYKEIVLGKDMLADILPPPEYILETHCINLQILYELENGNNREEISKLIERGNVLKKEFESRYEFWGNSLTDTQMKSSFLIDACEPAKGYYEIRDSQFIPAITSGNIEEAKRIFNSSLSQKYREHRTAIDKVVTLSNQSNAGIETSAAEVLKSSFQLLVSLSAVLIIVSLLFCWVIYRMITKPLLTSVKAIKALALGDIDQNIEYSSKDELGDLTKSLNIMIDAIKKQTDAARNISDGNTAIRVEVRSDKDVLNQSINLIINSLNDLMTESTLLAQAAVDGKLTTRGDISKFKGGYKSIVQGVNDTLDAVIKPIEEAATCLDEMAKGNLTEYVRGDYKGDHAKIKDSLNSTLNSLNDILGQVSNAVDQVATGSSQVSDSSQSLSQGATEQAGSLEEITSSMTEMTSQTKQNAENATAANQLSASARESAGDGNGKMKKMLEAMVEINQSSNQISKIIKAIDEIAFQTNLLALNAAVEAARAGVHGKGFAVVAEEVRNLAQRSAKAAKETTELIEGSVKKVENGTGIANETAKALEEIVTGITKVTDLVGEIASASNEQAQGIEQVNQGLSQIDQVTQSNTASAEESASAAEELSSQAIQLKQMLAKFTLKGAGTWSSSNQREPMQSAPARSPKPAVTQGWGNNAKNNKARKPEPVGIALDDNDFGRF
jgi:methyl-accepting chemotaxis protein